LLKKPSLMKTRTARLRAVSSLSSRQYAGLIERDEASALTIEDR
jgi:hypothetical protein